MKETTAERLKQIMEINNLRQADILRRAEPYCKEHNVRLGRNDLSQYVSGKVSPGQEKLTILALALNVSETWLMGYDVPMERTPWSKIDCELIKLGEELDHFDERLAFSVNFSKVMKILGYELTKHWKEGPDGESIELIENEDYQIEVPYGVYKELVDASRDFIKFQLNELFKEYPNTPRDKTFDNMTDEEFNAYFSDDEKYADLDTAHERTNIEVTNEMRRHDDDIKDDENF